MENIFPEKLVQPWNADPPKIHIVGNLPFGVSTPLIIRWLNAIADKTQAWRYGRTPLTLMFQKEIGERMTAQPGSPQRSRLSIMTQYLCDVKINFIINGRSFVPPPDVDAALVHFTPRVEPLIPYPFKVVEKVVRHVFQFRQKICKHGIL
jgi:dimethyladenosine transferase 1